MRGGAGVLDRPGRLTRVLLEAARYAGHAVDWFISSALLERILVAM